MNQQISAPQRFATLFAESMAIGRKPNGGTDRMALTPDDCAHREWFVGQLHAAGAEVRVDAAGNIFGLFTWDDDAPYILCGSHLDSQENGGVYDGAYGVVAALCAARAVDDAVRVGQLAPKANLAVVDWTNEEGARFEPSLMGSRVFTGALRLSDVEQAQDLDGVRFGDALRKARIAVELVDAYNVLFLVTYADNTTDYTEMLARVEQVLCELEAHKRAPQQLLAAARVPQTQAVLSLREVFYRKKQAVPLAQAVGKICGEQVSFYPPGIPVLLPGELVTEEIIAYCAAQKALGLPVSGPADSSLQTLRIIEN